MKKNQKKLVLILFSVLLLFTMCNPKGKVINDDNVEKAVTDKPSQNRISGDTVPQQEDSSISQLIDFTYPVYYKFKLTGQDLPIGYKCRVFKRGSNVYTELSNTTIKEYYLIFNGYPPYVADLDFVIVRPGLPNLLVPFTDNIPEISNNYFKRVGAKNYRIKKIPAPTPPSIGYKDYIEVEINSTGAIQQIVVWPPTVQ